MISQRELTSRVSPSQHGTSTPPRSSARIGATLRRACLRLRLGTGLPRWCVLRLVVMFGPPSCANNEQWSVDRATSITTLPTGAGQCYSALFSPHTLSLLSTAGQDGTVRLWDLRTTANPRPGVAFQPQMSFRAGPAEILAADWNKYHPGVLATAGKDGVVRVWDTRNPSRPTAEMQGHSLAIRKVQ